MEKSKIALIIGVALLVIGMLLTGSSTSFGTFVTIAGFVVSAISVYFFVKESK